MKRVSSQIWALERTFWKKLNGFAFSFIVFNGGENPNKTFLICINVKWKLVCSSAARLLTYPVSYHSSRFSRPHTRFYSTVQFPLHSLSLDKLLLQVQIREILYILMCIYVCVLTAKQKFIKIKWAKHEHAWTYFFLGGGISPITPSLSLPLKQWELLLKCM